MSHDQRFKSSWDDALGAKKPPPANRDVTVPKAESKAPPPRRVVPLIIKAEKPPAHYGDEFLDKPMEEVLREQHERNLKQLDSLSNALGATPAKSESSGCATVVGAAALLILLVIGGVAWTVQNASVVQESGLIEYSPVERPRGDGQGKLNGGELGGPGSVKDNSSEANGKGGVEGNSEAVAEMKGSGTSAARDESRDELPNLLYEMKDMPGREYIQVMAFSASQYSPNVRSLDSGEEITYTPGNLVDGDLSTAWATAELNEGRGEVVRFRESGGAVGMEIYSGYHKSHPKLGDLFWLNNRVRTLRITPDGWDPGPLVDIPDTAGPITVMFSEPLPRYGAFSMEIVEVYPSRPRPGTTKRWAQVAISEVRFFK